jgi:hypothetical protein
MVAAAAAAAAVGLDWVIFLAGEGSWDKNMAVETKPEVEKDRGGFGARKGDMGAVVY